MADFLTLSCPTCGGKLRIVDGIDRFACSYCGQEHVVNRGEGIVFLKPVVEGLKHVQSGVDKTAAELSISRLQRELQVVDAQISTKEYSRPRKQTLENWREDYVRWALRSGSLESKARKDFERFRREYERNKLRFETEWQSAYQNELKKWEEEIFPLQQRRKTLLAQLERNRKIVES